MRFIKMQGTGNDFVVVDGVSEQVDLDIIVPYANRICDRRFGIGSDGLIFVLPSRIADFRMRMFNPDGSEAEMCGNGTRCVARFVYDHGLTDATSISLETLAGVKAMRLYVRGRSVEAVRVDMGAPSLRRSEIPMRGPDSDQVVDETIRVAGRKLRVTAVSMGNPHAVLFDVGADMTTVTSLGPLIEKHPRFPRRTNVQFAEVLSNTEVVLRTWERGAGVTLGCGTGACATVVAGALSGRLNRRVTVHLLGGDLLVEWTGTNTVLMTGPAEEVFQGEYPL